MNILFENLALIPLLLEEVQRLNERLDSVSLELKTGTQVMRFLDISKATLFNLRENGRLKEGVHYEKIAGKLVYITDGIIEFKKEYVKSSKGQHSSTVIANDFFAKFSAA